MKDFTRLTKKERRQLRREEKMRMKDQVKKRSLWRTWKVWAGITATVVVVALIWFSSPNKQKTQFTQTTPTPPISKNMSGADFIASRLSHDTLNLDGKTTWEPNPSNLPALMQVFSLAPADPSLLHNHVHLDIFINGENVPVPAQIGLSNQAEVPTHTHDSTGIVHVEASDVSFKPTLGLFFDVWGVSFTEKNIGGYVTDEKQQLSAFVNGKKYKGDLRQMPFNQHDEIVIVFGNNFPNPMPTSYDFPGEL